MTTCSICGATDTCRHLKLSSTLAVPEAQCAILRSVKRGDYVKRKVDSNKVYRKGDYDRSTDSYSLLDCDDISHEIFVKAGKTVFIGFTY